MNQTRSFPSPQNIQSHCPPCPPHAGAWRDRMTRSPNIRDIFFITAQFGKPHEESPGNNPYPIDYRSAFPAHKNIVSCLPTRHYPDKLELSPGISLREQALDSSGNDETLLFPSYDQKTGTDGIPPKKKLSPKSPSLKNKASFPKTRLTPAVLFPSIRAQHQRRGSQVVRRRSAKSLFAGSIPAPASMFTFNILRL